MIAQKDYARLRKENAYTTSVHTVELKTDEL